MARPKGLPKTGGGSRKGRPNKISADIKAAILAAFDKVGGAAYLERQAEENPVAFMGLLAKVLPLQVAGTAEAPITIKLVRYDNAGDDSYTDGRPAAPPIIDADAVRELTPVPAAGAAEPPLPPSSLPPSPAPGSAASMGRYPPLTVVPNPNRDRWRIWASVTTWLRCAAGKTLH
jgi:hypothetical protein